MRKFDRAVIINCLCFAAAGSAFVVACTSSNSETASGGPAVGGEEGGVEGGPQLTADASSDTADTVPPQACAKDVECPSGVCNLATKLCAAPTCMDGVKNAVETDIDCGGDCKKCDQLKKCKLAADCEAGVCKDVGLGAQCQPPNTSDGVKNGIETGIDCGGTGNPTCSDGQPCELRDDCTSGYCKAKVCTAVTPDDGDQNGTETDIDCGGPGAKRCADGKNCVAADGSDCVSDVCTGGVCQAPSYTDEKKNGNETDLDCGGDLAHPCGVGLNCLVGSDCSSLGCNYNKKCAVGRSCTGHYGGDTCGFGGDGSVGAEAWESCCETASVTPATGPTAGVAVKLGKYQVTAGRIRAFLTDPSVNYNVRAFVQAARAEGKIPLIPGNDPVNAGRRVLEPEWDVYLPTSFEGNNNADEVADCSQSDTTTSTGNICKPNTLQAGIYTGVKKQLGGIIFKGNDQTSTGCFVGAPGTHAFRFPDGDQDGAKPEHDQNVYDTKSMQCIPYLMAQAFCVWDGGRLELGEEWVAAWGGSAMPWGPAVTLAPVEPSQRAKLTTNGMGTVACSAATVNADCGNATPAQPTYACVANQCVLAEGSRTYWGCRFPWASDASRPACGLTWPATRSIEWANYKYSYEFPKLGGEIPIHYADYIVHVSAPGRTRGRGPAGHADVIGNNYGITSNVGYNADPFVATHGWNASGSWEVHGYSKPASGQSRTSNLLNKYGKLGLRCAYP